MDEFGEQVKSNVPHDDGFAFWTMMALVSLFVGAFTTLFFWSLWTGIRWIHANLAMIESFFGCRPELVGAIIFGLIAAAGFLRIVWMEVEK